MTEQPADPLDDELDDPWHDQLVEAGDTFGAPDVLALVAFVVAVASVFALGVMNGSAYVIPFFSASDGDNGTRLVVGTVLGAALAMVPVGLGWRAVSRSLPGDPSWVMSLARAAMLLGLMSGLLRLIVAFIQAAHDGPSGFTRL